MNSERAVTAMASAMAIASATGPPNLPGQLGQICHCTPFHVPSSQRSAGGCGQQCLFTCATVCRLNQSATAWLSNASYIPFALHYILSCGQECPLINSSALCKKISMYGMFLFERGVPSDSVPAVFGGCRRRIFFFGVGREGPQSKVCVTLLCSLPASRSVELSQRLASARGRTKHLRWPCFPQALSILSCSACKKGHTIST